VSVNETKKEARVSVPVDQLSLAIGKQGQNVRLAAKLTGWKLMSWQECEGRSGEEENVETKEDVAVEKKETEQLLWRKSPLPPRLPPTLKLWRTSRRVKKKKVCQEIRLR